jgi:hypothetical protein
LRSIGLDGGGDGRVRYSLEVLIELFIGFDREDLVRKRDSVLVIRPVSSGDNCKGWLGRMFAA